VRSNSQNDILAAMQPWDYIQRKQLNPKTIRTIFGS